MKQQNHIVKQLSKTLFKFLLTLKSERDVTLKSIQFN